MSHIPREAYYSRFAEGIPTDQPIVAVFGTGAIGSLTAERLGSTGVDLLLIDRAEPLEVENLIRHAAPAKHLGELKAAATAKYLRARLPADQDVRSVTTDSCVATSGVNPGPP